MGRTLGEGSFGKVRLGTHILTGEKVAVKVLEKSRLVEAADVQRVAREIKILKRNRHQNIIQLFEVLDTPTAIYLIMENADAGEMFNYIVRNKRVEELQACRFFHQIIDGAEYLHDMEVTHRDLKPENLLLQSSTHGLLVKIVDFGLSNTHDGGTLLQTACGSPCYAAPEMIAGLRYWGPKADVWSMGVILYALVCGYLPFEDSNTATLYKKIMAGTYTCPSWISSEVRDLISRILNTDPAKRMSISEIRQHRWYSQISKFQACESGALAQTLDAKLPDPLVLAQIEAIGIHRKVVEDALHHGLHNNATTTYHLLRNRRLRNAQNSADVKQDASGCAKQFNYPEQCREEPDALEAYPNIPKLCLPKPSSATEYSVGTNNASRNPQSTTNTQATTARAPATKRPASAGASVHVSQTARLCDVTTLDPLATKVSQGSSVVSALQSMGNRSPLFLSPDHGMDKYRRPSISSGEKKQNLLLCSELHQNNFDTTLNKPIGIIERSRIPTGAKSSVVPRQPSRPNTRQRKQRTGSRALALNVAVR